MNYEIAILKGIEGLTRRCTPATPERLSQRVGGEVGHVRRAVARLERAGLVRRVGDAARLTFEGLAVSVATVDRRRASRDQHTEHGVESGVNASFASTFTSYSSGVVVQMVPPARRNAA